MQKLDVQDEEIRRRIFRILVDIAIYAKQRGMSVVWVFRGIERAFREFPDNQDSFIPKNHKKFYDMMIASVPKKLSEVCDNVSSSDPNFFHAIAEALSLIPDEFLKNFGKDFFIQGLTGPYSVTDRIKFVW